MGVNRVTIKRPDGAQDWKPITAEHDNEMVYYSARARRQGADGGFLPTSMSSFVERIVMFVVTIVNLTLFLKPMILYCMLQKLLGL